MKSRVATIRRRPADRAPVSAAARLAAALCGLSLWLAAALPAGAQALSGVALVIGQSDYEHLAPLANPAGDADAIEELFSGLGFDTTQVSDRDARRLARDLERFLEDAEDADVAVVYYAGHGIEAAGENFLIPVDADLSALDAAGERLVPLSRFLQRLRSSVPLAIVLLDACRDNPFPPGATLRLEPGAEPAPVAAGGLGETRGARRLSDQAPAVDSLGAVIGFAAEPGHAALDGPPGGNSPYAAALLRHLDAMAGAEFGLVMRMVGEEVYLKTAGRQRPWINESLRRQLFFGEAPQPLAGDEGDLLAERRQLLITVSALPDFSRRQVELASAEGGVPMDALYGMLRAMGADVPDDPTRLEDVLRAEADRLETVLAERRALTSPDDEIVRLTALADSAEKEGLLETAGELRQRAKARFRTLEATLEERQAALDRRFIEGAAVFARSAETRSLAFDHLGAAEDYAEAFRLVSSRDAELAWRYANGEIVALTAHGKAHGDPSALRRAIDRSDRSLTGAAGTWSIGATHNNRANAYLALADLDGTAENYRAAAASYREAIAAFPVAGHAADWAMAQSNLAVALRGLGRLQGDDGMLREAEVALRAALDVRRRDRFPRLWADTQVNLGNLLYEVGLRDPAGGSLRQALDAYAAAAGEIDRERQPLAWGLLQNNIGLTKVELGAATNDVALLREAVASLRLALEERTRVRVPLEWAQTASNLARALTRLGIRENDPSRFDEAIDLLNGAIGEASRERAPRQWSIMKANLGTALLARGASGGDAGLLAEGVEAHRLALEEISRDDAPFEWARQQVSYGVALDLLGQNGGGPASFRQAVSAFEAALGSDERRQSPHLRATANRHLATTLLRLDAVAPEPALLPRAASALRAAGEALDPVRDRTDWISTKALLAYALKASADRLGDGRASDYLTEAATALDAVTAVMDRQADARLWAETRNDMGHYLALAGELAGDITRVERGERVLREALSTLAGIGAPTLPFVENSLCHALRARGTLQADRAALDEARAHCQASLDGFEAAASPLTAQARADLEAVDTAIAALE